MVTFWGDVKVVAVAMAFALSFELACCFMRFGLGKTSTGNTGLIGLLTGGIRIHHGYVGVVLILIRNLIPAVELPLSLNLATVVAGIGWGCVLSDGFHHFWVLWPATGHHDFDLVYPKNHFPALEKLENDLRDDPLFAKVGMAASMILIIIFVIIPR